MDEYIERGAPLDADDVVEALRCKSCAFYGKMDITLNGKSLGMCQFAKRLTMQDGSCGFWEGGKTNEVD